MVAVTLAYRVEDMTQEKGCGAGVMNRRETSMEVGLYGSKLLDWR